MYRKTEQAWIILDIVTMCPAMSAAQEPNTDGNVKYSEGEESAGLWASQCGPALVARERAWDLKSGGLYYKHRLSCSSRDLEPFASKLGYLGASYNNSKN